MKCDMWGLDAVVGKQLLNNALRQNFMQCAVKTGSQGDSFTDFKSQNKLLKIGIIS